ncbi:MAG: S41 family peptidase [Flavipsychrobacter sp.]
MRKLIVITAFVISLTSCEKAIFKKDGVSTSPRQNFDHLWKELDKRYAYFTYKKIDWNQAYTTYAGRVYEGMSEDSLFNVMGAMLNDLKDGHTNLVSPFNRSRFDITLLGPQNIDDRVITEYYLKGTALYSGPFTHAFMRNKEVGYIRFKSFPGTVDDVQLDYIIDRYKDTKGLIFDIRQNGGGAINDAYQIVSRFITANKLVYQVQDKKGAGHEDFDQPKQYVLKASSKTKYLKKIVVLTDRGTYSSGSFFTLMAKAISTMKVMGDTTGGGLGLPNGGQLPNGWTYRCSITRTLDVNGNNYENGIPPDVRVMVDKARLAQGIDDVLEAALKDI